MRVFISGDGSHVTIPEGYAAVVGILPESNPPYNMIFGPEWGASLTIRGYLMYDWYVVPVQWNAAGPRSLVAMYGDSYLSGEGIALGDSWWWHGGPYVDMKMYDNAYAEINWMFWGGHLYLYNNATMRIAYGLTVDTIDAVSDATRRIEINDDAKLNLPYPQINISGTLYNTTDVLNDWISRGILKFYGGGGFPVFDTESEPGRIHVMALVPEPSSIGLLALAGLVGGLYLRQRSR